MRRAARLTLATLLSAASLAWGTTSYPAEVGTGAPRKPATTTS